MPTGTGTPGTPSGAISSGTGKDRVASFVKNVTPQAEKVAAELGVPVNAVIGQWGLETGWGKSVIAGTNNLGNIKDFSGGGLMATDSMTGSRDAYRKYGSTDEFAGDFTKLLSNTRYAGVKGAADPTAYFSALKSGGYAEDPDYVRKGASAAALVAQARAAQAPAVIAPAAAAPKQVGAFALETDAENISTSTLKINPGTGRTGQATKPVEIPPDTQWQKPITAVRARSNALPKGGGEKAIVTYVGDGDGATLQREDGSSINCRIDTIDAPETAKPRYNKPGQPFGEEAKRTLAQMIENKQVTVRVTRPATATTGKDARALCQIEIEGVGVDKEMLRQGAAWLYRRYANDPELSRIEQEARREKRGLWAETNPEYPETFRRRLEKQGK